MYQIVYYYKEMINGELMEERVSGGAKFRLRRNALHFILDMVRMELIDEGYATEPIISGINCYKSESLKEGKRKIIELRVVVEKG